MWKDVEIHLIENDTSKEIGLEELAMLDIKVKPVPDLNGGSSTSTSTAVDARHAQELQEARDEAARSAAEGVMLSTIRRLRRLVAAYKLVDVRVDKQNVKTSGAGR